MDTVSPLPLPDHLRTTSHHQTPSQLDLSPSKARAHATTTHTWSLVTSWLTKLYAPNAVPAFERNADTLAALQALMRANGKADGNRRLLWEARGEELRNYQMTVAEGRTALLEEKLMAEVEGELSPAGMEAVDALAKTSLVLGVMPSMEPGSTLGGSELGVRMMGVTHEMFMLEHQLRKIEELRASLEREMEQTQLAMNDLKTQDDEAEMEKVQAKTARWTRETKQIGLKLSEYKERIAGLERFGQEGLTIEEVRDAEKEMDERKKEVKGLENILHQLSGLPPDIEASRAEIKRAQAELDGLKRKRGALFEKIGRA